MSERTDKLKAAIETMHKCTAQYVDSTPVFETFQGNVIWDGVVDTFALTGNPKAQRCHAWTTDESVVTVLEIPPVDSPETAVKIAIASGQITPA